jgi:hypothetical protein
MQSTNIRQIKTALVEQAFVGKTRVSWFIGPVVAESQEKGPTPRDDSWLGSLAYGGECAY